MVVSSRQLWFVHCVWMVIGCLTETSGQQANAPAPYVVPAFVPTNYTHLYSSSDGQTHFATCVIESVPLSSLAGQSSLQSSSYSAELAPGNRTLFNQLPVGEVSARHCSLHPFEFSSFVTLSCCARCGALVTALIRSARCVCCDRSQLRMVLIRRALVPRSTSHRTTAQLHSLS